MLRIKFHNLFRFAFYKVIVVSNKRHNIELVLVFWVSIFFYHMIK